MDTTSLSKRTLSLSMMQMKGYINGISFMDMDHTYKIMSYLGGWEVWEIVNQNGMDHPFHQHVNSAQVLTIIGGDSGYASLYTSIPALPPRNRPKAILLPYFPAFTTTAHNLAIIKDLITQCAFFCLLLLLGRLERFV